MQRRGAFRNERSGATPTQHQMVRASMALSLICGDAQAQATAIAPLENGSPEDSNAFLQFLEHNGLAPLWFHELHTQGLASHLSATFLEGLKTATIKSTIAHTKQANSLHKAIECLCAAGIPVLVIKGMALRLALYDQPQLRPALDVDLLVQPEMQRQAVCALTRCGMTPELEAASIDHEITFIHDDTAIDLHWDIFRTGRSDPALVAEMFEHQVQLDNIAVPGSLHDLYLMLTHPVITNYPLAELSLVRLVDIHHRITRHAPDWAALEEMLARYRTRTAAWLSLSLAQRLTSTPVPNGVVERLAPGWLRARYLEGWIAHDMSTRLQRHATLRKLGYSLPLYDSLRDALISTRRYLASQGRSHVVLHDYETLIAQCLESSANDQARGQRH